MMETFNSLARFRERSDMKTVYQSRAILTPLVVAAWTKNYAMRKWRNVQCILQCCIDTSSFGVIDSYSHVLSLVHVLLDFFPFANSIMFIGTERLVKAGESSMDLSVATWAVAPQSTSIESGRTLNTSGLSMSTSKANWCSSVVLTVYGRLGDNRLVVLESRLGLKSTLKSIFAGLGLGLGLGLRKIYNQVHFQFSLYTHLQRFV